MGDHAVVIDGRIVPARAALVPIMDDGFIRGDGAFEVLAVYGGRPFALGEHLDRLERSCVALRIRCPRAALGEDVTRLLQNTGPVTCALRLILTIGGRRVVFTEPWSPPHEPTRLALVENQAQPLLRGVKSLSYAGNMLSGRLAREQGCDDALWISTEGRVLEAQTAAFFWASADGSLYTPPLSDGLLDSITRRVLLSQLTVAERHCGQADIAGCSEAFLASTLKEIQPVAAIDGRDLPRVPGPNTRQAIGAYQRIIEETHQ